VSTLSVELNGDAVHSIRAPDRFETTGPFAVALENEGRSTHVHLHFDDDLDRVVSVAETNHFVDDEATKHVHVSVADVAEPVRGKLKIVTGYGSETRYVDLRVDPPEDAAPDEVAVDEAFTKPPERPPEVSSSPARGDRGRPADRTGRRARGDHRCSRARRWDRYRTRARQRGRLGGCRRRVDGVGRVALLAVW